MSSRRWRLQTDLGRLAQADALELLIELPAESVDLFFADPPFNLGKDYGPRVDDRRRDAVYVAWCKEWLTEAIRLLTPGGSLFLYNLPRWNIQLAAWLEDRLDFRNWIAIDLKNRLPIHGRLYPAHYSLLYFTKGRARTFEPPRLPMATCRHCGRVVKDYGGYKDRLRLEGLSLSDVWTDISPVRPRRDRRSRPTNVLPIKMMDRILDIASVPGDLVLDPFAGSGTTLIAAELKHRQWLGIEIADVTPILKRFASQDVDRGTLASVDAAKNRLITASAALVARRNGHSYDDYGPSAESTSPSDEKVRRAAT